ncbi:MAG: hypothetical protein IPM82_03520 [Saprospiraceae bacterium]|nr:hypothetical protein [Saprospiraceae bacterium]
MKNEIEVNEKVGRMADILEQIKDLKHLIDLHQQGGSSLMEEQYVYRRQKLLKELREILLEFELNAAELVA